MMRGTGFTLIELLIVLTIATVVLGVGTASYRELADGSAAGRAARLVAADVSLTRSLAIRRGGNVSLVADERTRSYVVRDAAGTVLAARSFDGSSDLPLTSLDIRTPGDSLTFNPRGLLSGLASAQIDVARRHRSCSVQLNALGRHRLVRS